MDRNWKAPPADATADRLFPKSIGTYQRQNVDNLAAIPLLGITAKGRRGQYKDVFMLVRSLRAAPLIERSAKDLLRASDLPLLAADERSVKGDLKKISKGKPLEPVLLVAGDMSKGIPLVVADGYHRICAIYHYDEDAPVMCRMANS